MVNTQKKAISPVVATALLLVVAVVAVVGFQTWFNTYQSENFAKLNEQTAAGSAINFQLLTNTTLFIENTGATGDITYSVESCTDGTHTLTDGLNQVDLTGDGCTDLTEGESKSIRILTTDKVYSFTGTVQ